MEEGFKIVDNVIYMPNFEHQPDPRGIGWVYFDNMVKYRDRVAQIDGLTGEEDTFGALLSKCVRAAIALKELGVEYGDTISVCTYHHLNSCVPHISAMFIGAKMAALDPSLSLSHAIHLFKISIPKVVFANEESVQLIEDVISVVGSDTKIITFGQSEKHVSFLKFVESAGKEAEFEPVAVESIHDVAIVMFSSGTSGLPKGICHTHYSILRASPDVMKLRTFDSLTFTPDSLYWNAFMYYLHHNIQNGTTRLLFPKFDRSNPWQVFTYKVTMIGLGVSDMMTFCITPKPSSVDTNALQLIVTGGSPMTESQSGKLKIVFPNAVIRSNYGLTEVFSNTLCFDVNISKHLDLLRRKPNSCGMPKLGISYKIVDVETEKTLGPNQKGELRLKTEMQCSGYYNLASADVWDADGWLKTGDYGYYDEDYCFFVEDRIKEMFKYQYWHIIPAVLERILIRHPAVLKCVVIGKPHEADDNHPMAIVQLRNGASATEEEIRQFLEEQVEDRQKLRGGVKFVNWFPTTPSKKIRRFELKQMVMQGLI